MSDNQALKNLRTKYPQYESLDDSTLASKIVAKYPQYKDAFADILSAPPQVKTEPSILPGVTVTAQKPTEGAINLPPVPENELQAGLRTLGTPPSIQTPTTA